MGMLAGVIVLSLHAASMHACMDTKSRGMHGQGTM